MVIYRREGTRGGSETTYKRTSVLAGLCGKKVLAQFYFEKHTDADNKGL
jgi:hypothetical protein